MGPTQCGIRARSAATALTCAGAWLWSASCAPWTDPIDLRKHADLAAEDPVSILTRGQFSPPETVVELSSPRQDFDLTLTGDQLEIFFVRLDDGVGDIFVSTRDSVGAPWAMPVVAADLSRGLERDPEVSDDGLRIGLSSVREGAPNHNDLYEAARSRRDAPWSAPFPIPELSTPSSECCATTAADSTVMFFASDAAGTLDLYEARRARLGAAWGEVRPLTELNGQSDDSNPQLRAGGRFIIFDSDRQGNGARDLYIATRGSLDEPFEPPMPLGELDTEMDERDGWLSEDGKTLYFSSNASGNFEIVVARR